jgi:hypothetical protein
MTSCAQLPRLFERGAINALDSSLMHYSKTTSIRSAWKFAAHNSEKLQKLPWSKTQT